MKLKTLHGETNVPDWLVGLLRHKIKRKWLIFPGEKFVIGKMRGETLARAIKVFMRKRRIK